MLSESVNDQDAFSFLNEVKIEIFKNFGLDELMNTNGLQLNKGTEILKILSHIPFMSFLLFL